uniref:FAD-binding domain-containing protein n=1 Tax=Psilocybe cubensis TaxID=181762 RepID=A0A8H8CP85_PSICU
MASDDVRKPSLRIAICGGGIGGLCLAVCLSKFAHLEVKLYEAAGQFKEIGAGVMIWARTWRILQSMGLDREFSKIAHSPPTGAQGKFIRVQLLPKPEP